MTKPDAAVGDLFAKAQEAHVAGRGDEAEALYKQALALDPNAAEVLQALGNLYQGRGDLPAALDYYDRALEISPDFSLAHYNRGYALELSGRLDEAEQAYLAALDGMPNLALAHLRLGTVLQLKRDPESAIPHYERATELKPDWAEAWFQLGSARNENLQPEKALECQRRVLELQPESALGHFALGRTLRYLNRVEDAIEPLREAIRLGMGGYAEAQSMLANTLYAEGDQPEAKAHFEEALRLEPKSSTALLGLCTALIPHIYESQDEIRQVRQSYGGALDRLTSYYQAASHDERDAAASAVGTLLPYYLPYQGFNDRDLQQTFGTLMSQLMGARYPMWTEPRSPMERSAGRKLRVGFVSAYFNLHSNWKIPIKGWVEHIDRERFELFGYYTGKSFDRATDEAAEAFTTFTTGPMYLSDWCEHITDHRLDVLIYPEIGMEPRTFELACLRLAPIQVNSWGHPQTSGLPTIDYYLSSDLMEPPDGQDHYTEKLVRLPNLSIHYSPTRSQITPADRTPFGLSPDDIFFWCSQSVFKYLPQDDDIFIRIAERVPTARFVFLEDRRPPIAERFRARLRSAFEAAGQDFEQRCLLLPRLTVTAFASGAAQCDVSLDSLGWSGCNTTLEALAQDCPVVTLPGDLMRGRHTSAILTQMGLPELIAQSKDNYVDIAVRLATDKDYNRAVRDRIRQKRELLLGDLEPVRGLEKFLLEVAGWEKEPSSSVC